VGSENGPVPGPFSCIWSATLGCIAGNGARDRSIGTCREARRVMDELGNILGVWAHPDDEAYLTAGIMARAVRNGSRVVCVTATRGEGGSMDEEKWPPESMGEVRTEELERSLRILGVDEHVWLDMRDIDMDTGLPDEGYDRIREIVADVQPDTILTFGPDGMTGHAAHKDASAWATKALHEVGRPGSRVLYATVTPEFASEILPVWEPFNVFRPGTPPITPRDELAVYYELPEDILELKVNAINAHVSQVEAILEAVGPDLWWRQMSTEAFSPGEERT
jgi:LmbE family N-acetylglucosaminyl deacetylase